MTITILAALAAASPLPVTHICWISDVRPSGQGVAIEFVDGPRTVWRKQAGVSEQFVADPSTAEVTRDTAGIWRVKAVPAQLGDVLLVSNSPEDVCQLTVQRQGGVIGVAGEASFRMPNMPPDSRVEFIPAQ